MQIEGKCGNRRAVMVYTRMWGKKANEEKKRRTNSGLSSDTKIRKDGKRKQRESRRRGPAKLRVVGGVGGGIILFSRAESWDLAT
jgi:hypothetical protein